MNWPPCLLSLPGLEEPQPVFGVLEHGKAWHGAPTVQADQELFHSAIQVPEVQSFCACQLTHKSHTQKLLEFKGLNMAPPEKASPVHMQWPGKEMLRRETVTVLDQRSLRQCHDRQSAGSTTALKWGEKCPLLPLIYDSQNRLLLWIWENPAVVERPVRNQKPLGSSFRDTYTRLLYIPLGFCLVCRHQAWRLWRKRNPGIWWSAGASGWGHVHVGAVVARKHPFLVLITNLSYMCLPPFSASGHILHPSPWRTFSCGQLLRKVCKSA